MSDLNRKTLGAIPDALGSTNRGNDNRGYSTDSAQLAITLERINESIMNYLTTTLSPSVENNDAVQSVPVIYGTEERWVTVRQQGFLRDPNSNKIQAPLIMLRRTGERPGALVNPNNKYLHTTLDMGWNRRNAYDKFAVLNRIRPSPRYMNVVIPDYMDLTYEMILWAERQEQLDKMIEQLNVESQEYWGARNDFKFRVTIGEFSSQSDLPADEDRIIRSAAQVTVNAYLLPERMIRNFKTASTSQTAYGIKKVVTMVETVTTLDNLD